MTPAEQQLWLLEGALRNNLYAQALNHWITCCSAEDCLLITRRGTRADPTVYTSQP